MGGTPIADTAEGLLAACVAACPDPKPDRQLVSHNRPAWEVCATDQLAVYVAQVPFRQSRGNAARGMAQARVTWTVELVRCTPGRTGDLDPTPAALTASALGLLRDFDAIEAAVEQNAAALFGVYPSVQWGTATPLGPLGNVGGWSWPFTADRV